MDDWATASRPPSEEESAAFEEAFARQFGAPRRSLEERIQAEQDLAARLVESRRRAQEALKERNGD